MGRNPKKEKMARNPIFSVCIAYILGIIFQDYCVLRGDILGVFLVIFILFIIVSFWFSVRSFRIFCFSGLFFSLGAFCHYLNENQNPNIIFNEKEKIIFSLDKKLNSNEKNRRYEITILGKSQKIKAVASIPKDAMSLDYLHYYQADAYINKIEKPQYSHRFDYQKYMSRKDIFYQLYLPNKIQKSRKKSLSFTEKIKQYRQNVLNNIDKSSKIQPNHREFLKGIILADRTEIDQSTLDSFTKTGLMHILAISGAHIAVIFVVALFLCRLVLPQRFAVAVSLLFIWGFVVFIGFGNSVFRAAIMLSMYYLYVVLQRIPNVFHTLGLSALVILILNTNEVFDIGFQLSFCAVWGIYIFNNPLMKLFPKRRNKIFKYLQNTISLTISAQLATLPLVLYYFHQFPLISLISNLVAIPLAEIIIMLSFFVAIFLGLGFNSEYLEIMYDYFVDFFLRVIHFFSQADEVYLQHIPMNGLEVIVLFIIVLCCKYCIVNTNFRNIVQLISMVLIFIGLRTFLDVKSYQKNEILVHKDYKGNILSIKNKNKIYFFIPENSDENRLKKYIVFPYIHESRTSDFTIKYYPKNTETILYKGSYYKLKPNKSNQE